MILGRKKVCCIVGPFCTVIDSSVDQGMIVMVVVPGWMADGKKQLIMHKKSLKAKTNALRKRPSEEKSWLRKRGWVSQWLILQSIKHGWHGHCDSHCWHCGCFASSFSEPSRNTQKHFLVEGSHYPSTCAPATSIVTSTAKRNTRAFVIFCVMGPNKFASIMTLFLWLITNSLWWPLKGESDYPAHAMRATQTPPSPQKNLDSPFRGHHNEFVLTS